MGTRGGSAERAAGARGGCAIAVPFVSSRACGTAAARGARREAQSAGGARKARPWPVPSRPSGTAGLREKHNEGKGTASAGTRRGEEEESNRAELQNCVQGEGVS